MALFDRLIPVNDTVEKITVDAFTGVLLLWAIGDKTRAEVEALYGLDANDAHLTWLKNQYDVAASNGKAVQFILGLHMLLAAAESRNPPFGLDDLATLQSSLVALSV